MKWNPSGNRRERVAEPEGEISDPEKFDNHASLKILAKDGMALLEKHYPGWQWAIQINEFGGMMSIFNLHLHDAWGYTMRIIEIEHDPTRSIFVKGGGELLERFKMPRGRIDYAALVNMERDIRGRGIPHLSDLEHASAKRMRRKKKIDEALRHGRVRVNPLTKAIEVGLLDG